MVKEKKFYDIPLYFQFRRKIGNTRGYRRFFFFHHCPLYDPTQLLYPGRKVFATMTLKGPTLMEDVEKIRDGVDAAKGGV